LAARYDGVQRANEAIRVMRLAKDMTGKPIQFKSWLNPDFFVVTICFELKRNLEIFHGSMKAFLIQPGTS
jgi:hypothetical protein